MHSTFNPFSRNHTAAYVFPRDLEAAWARRRAAFDARRALPLEAAAGLQANSLCAVTIARSAGFKSTIKSRDEAMHVLGAWGDDAAEPAQRRAFATVVDFEALTRTVGLGSLPAADGPGEPLFRGRQ